MCVQKTAVGRKASLSVVLGYNQSDSNIGWYSFLSGVTMYYSSPSEEFVDPLNSLSLPPETVPMLSVVQASDSRSVFIRVPQITIISTTVQPFTL